MSPSTTIEYRSIAQVYKSGLRFKTIMHRLKGLFWSIARIEILSALRLGFGFISTSQRSWFFTSMPMYTLL
jgi:hypothetical protein